MTNAYDGFGRQTSSTINLDGVTRTLSYQYDANSNRTRVTHPDGNWFGYSCDAANRPLSAGQGATSGLFAFTYNNKGQMTQKTSGGTPAMPMNRRAA